MLTRSIWSRSGINEMGKAAYIRMIAFTTLIESVLVGAGVYSSYGWKFSWWLLIGTFVASVVGIVMFNMSEDWLVSLVGVSVMSFSLGLMIGPAVAAYSSAMVLQAVFLTALIMGVMSVMGIMFPKIFEGFAPYVLAALTFLLITQFAQLFFIWLGFAQATSMTWIAWLGVAIFIVIVAVDWSRALSLPQTMDNAVDASGGLILDAVNIFIRMLQILGGSRSSSK